MIKFLEVKGNDYEIGFQVGEFFKDYLQDKNNTLNFDEKTNRYVYF